MNMMAWNWQSKRAVCVGCNAVNRSSVAVCSSDVADTMKVWHVCGIYDSFQTLTCTLYYLKLWQRDFFSTLSNFFSSLFPPLAFPLVFNWVPKCGRVQKCWNISRMVGRRGGSLCVAEAYAWINLCDVNKWLTGVWSTPFSITHKLRRSSVAALDHPPSCAEMVDVELNKTILSPKSVFVCLMKSSPGKYFSYNVCSSWLDWNRSHPSWLTSAQNVKKTQTYQALIITIALIRPKIFYSGSSLSFFVTYCTPLAFSSRGKNHVFYVKPVIAPGE